MLDSDIVEFDIYVLELELLNPIYIYIYIYMNMYVCTHTVSVCKENKGVKKTDI